MKVGRLEFEAISRFSIKGIVTDFLRSGVGGFLSPVCENIGEFLLDVFVDGISREIGNLVWITVSVVEFDLGSGSEEDVGLDRGERLRRFRRCEEILIGR